MPWCPKCKSEYKEGFLVCSDCGVKLVDTLENKKEKVLCSSYSKEISDKLISYLNYSKISCTINETSSEDGILYQISVDESKFRNAKTAMTAFVKIEDNLFAKQNIDSTYFIGDLASVQEEIDNENNFDENIADENDSEDNDENDEEETVLLTPASSVIYESKSEKADEAYGSGIMLFCVGIGGIIARCYMMKGNFSLNFSTIGLFVVFGAMAVYGIYSVISSKRLRKEAVDEKIFVDSIQKWLTESISKADIISCDIPGNTPENNYFVRTAYIKKQINDNYPDLNDNFVDNIVDDFYDSVFDE